MGSSPKYKQAYQHVESLLCSSTAGILEGLVYVFPKLDGTNATVWQDENGKIRFGSSRREISVESDNYGFAKHMTDNYMEALGVFFNKYPNHVIAGEFLVQVNIKDYVPEAVRQFHVFDVYEVKSFDADTGRANREYLEYEIYNRVLIPLGFLVIPPLLVDKDPTIQDIKDVMNKNSYLMKEGCVGEGVVVKNYEYRNRFNRQPWAKLIVNRKIDKVKQKINSNQNPNEAKIVKSLITFEAVKKPYNDIVLANGCWSIRYLSKLLGMVFRDFITDNIFQIIKKSKGQAISFNAIRHQVDSFTKATLEEILKIERESKKKDIKEAINTVEIITKKGEGKDV